MGIVEPKAGPPRPLAVTVIAGIFLAVGAGMFAYHFPSLVAWRQDAVWVEGTEFLAIVIGVFLLRGANWARWLAVSWLGFHVLIVALNGFQMFAVHVLIFAGITWLLVRPESGRYFRGAGVC